MRERLRVYVKHAWRNGIDAQRSKRTSDLLGARPH
jgi:hypothetical protein